MTDSNFFDFKLRKKEILYDIKFYVFLAFLYYMFSQLEQKQLLSILVLLCIMFFLYIYNKQHQKDVEKKKIKFNKEHDLSEEDIHEISSKFYPHEKIPKKFRALHRFPKLLELYESNDFIFKRDKEKKKQLVTHLDKFCKYYSGLLIERYNIKDYFALFIDTKREILNILISYYHVIPYFKTKHDYKHIYKDALKSCINEIKANINEMTLNIVEQFDLHKKGEYIYKNPIEYNRVEMNYDYY